MARTSAYSLSPEQSGSRLENPAARILQGAVIFAYFENSLVVGQFSDLRSSAPLHQQGRIFTSQSLSKRKPPVPGPGGAMQKCKAE
jgi:hypothetical protein